MLLLLVLISKKRVRDVTRQCHVHLEQFCKRDSVQEVLLLIIIIVKPVVESLRGSGDSQMGTNNQIHHHFVESNLSAGVDKNSIEKRILGIHLFIVSPIFGPSSSFLIHLCWCTHVGLMGDGLNMQMKLNLCTTIKISLTYLTQLNLDREQMSSGLFL